MDEKQIARSNNHSNRFQDIINSLAKCKIDFMNEREERRKVQEINYKLEVELKQTRELEKSHRYHLLTSRETVGNLQETVSQLVYLKRDVKKLKDEMAVKDAAIAAVERDKEAFIHKQNERNSELHSAHEQQIEELKITNERKYQQLQHESDTQIALSSCIIEELRSKIKDMETEHRDKVNVLMLEYEERIQREAAQVAQLQEQLARQAAHTDSNIDAYRRRLEELEEKLKQTQFKQYVAQSSYSSQFESQVERPYSVTKESYADSVDLNPVLASSKQMPASNQNRVPRPSNTLQVTYYGNKTPNPPKSIEKKGQFNISKKRKLYSEKNLHDF